MMDILFVRPNDKKNIYGSLTAGVAAVEPPVWALVLAAYLKEQGFSVDFFDPEAEDIEPASAARRIVDANARLVCVTTLGSNLSASTWKMAGARILIEEIRAIDANQKLMLWGLHPSALPLRTMQEEAIDFLCQGEGFSTLPQLLQRLHLGVDEWRNIPGLWYRNKPLSKEDIGHGTFPEVFPNLDLLPMADWQLASPLKYRAHNWHCFDGLTKRTPYATIFTSLGCPFKCSFCALHTLFGASAVRFRSPEKVVAEIDFLVKTYGVRNIKILDECFVLKRSHVEEICDRIIAGGYDLNIWAYARIDTIEPALLQKLKQAGFNWLAYGIESGSSSSLAGVQKKGYNQEKIREVVRKTQEMGIHVVGNFMFGLPEDTAQSMAETLRFAMELNCEYTNFYVTMAYPGSQLYAEAIENNVRLPETWLGYSQYSEDTLGLPTACLTSEEVLSFRDHAFQAFHSRAEYLAVLTRVFGDEIADHMQKLAAKPLVRKHCTASAAIIAETKGGKDHEK